VPHPEIIQTNPFHGLEVVNSLRLRIECSKSSFKGLLLLSRIDYVPQLLRTSPLQIRISFKMHGLINLPMSYVFFLILHLTLAQSTSTDCNSACINYLTALENEKNIVNAAVWDHSGPVTAQQINTVCTLANPLACCNCGGTGLTSGIETEVLAAWAVTCNTFNTVQDGGASAVTCWTSSFNQGCTDYDNLLEGGSCGSSGSGSGNSQSSGSGNAQSTGSGNAQSSGSGNAQSTGSGNAQSTGSSGSGTSGSKTSSGSVSQTPSKSDAMTPVVQNHGLMIMGAILAFVVNAVEFLSG